MNSFKKIFGMCVVFGASTFLAASSAEARHFDYYINQPPCGVVHIYGDDYGNGHGCYGADSGCGHVNVISYMTGIPGTPITEADPLQVMFDQQSPPYLQSFEFNGYTGNAALAASIQQVLRQ